MVLHASRGGAAEGDARELDLPSLSLASSWLRLRIQGAAYPHAAEPAGPWFLRRAQDDDWGEGRGPPPTSSLNRGARFSRLARTASAWLGERSSASCAALSAARMAGASASAASANSRLAARTASGLRAAMARAIASARSRGSGSR